MTTIEIVAGGIMSIEHYELTDRFSALSGRTFLSGIQALARLPIEQLLVDRRVGLNTAAFVSGYPGSPLGGFDAAITQAASVRDDLPIHHVPGLNEEYAATSVMGSQVAAARDESLVDGVVGLWYGKAPGVDRAVDALRHGCYAGTTPTSGVVALVGDDPVAKSSTVPSSSAGVLADLHMPLLYPGDPAEALDLGRHAIALSRASGLWSALKIVSDVADGTAAIDLDIERVVPLVPHLADEVFSPRTEGRLLTPRTLDIEREIYEVRYPLAVEYARINRLNAVTVGTASDWIGILASGITYREVREALDRLGLSSDDEIRSAGIRLFRMQMPIPFDPTSVREFADGLDEIIVVEEKAPNLEMLIKDALYGSARHPLVVGKLDETGGRLFPGYGALDADTILPLIRTRLSRRLEDRLAPVLAPGPALIPLTVERTPFFCSGCPHNRSTEVPAGSLVGAGIGCHTMTMLMDPERVGEIAGLTPMGNEGTQWIGMAPFLPRDHMIQNLGDGTFFHSGQLAVTAAVAAGVNVTYKLLYNGAIAMTGGQTPRGQLPPARVARVLLEQGVSRVIITSDEPERVARRSVPDGVDVWHRDRLVEAQEVLSATPGVTVLIHDQACAAEARRLRKRGSVPTPSERVVINPRVCEGCGDCGRVSNCLSVQPVDTPFGRRTRIDQTTCNLDYSCLEGDCPSFAVVDTDPGPMARLLSRLFDPRRDVRTAGEAKEVSAEALPDPVPIVSVDDFALRITGIGGTGVVTVAQVLGTAAMLDGFEVRGLDQIGLSQKAGPVVSDLRLSRGEGAHTNRLGDQQADLLLALDQLVAASDKGLRSASLSTVVVGSTSFTPTGAMVTHPERLAPSAEELSDRIAAATDGAHQFWADAVAITTSFLGDAVTANVFVVGMAVQAGALPVSVASVEEALRLNGAAVEKNLSAFRLGRSFVAGVGEFSVPDSDERAAPADARFANLPDRVVAVIDLLADDLVGFQGRRLAGRFLDLVASVAAVDDAGRLTETAARGLHRVMAYKDEYEVARLMFLDDGRAEARRVAGAAGVMSVRLHPPILRALGVDRKISFGPGWFPMFRLLARLRFLRGTPFDPFGWLRARREERELRDSYVALVADVVARVGEIGVDAAEEVLGLVDAVRGFEGIKRANIEAFRVEVARRGFELR
jgi:indolepyruvate ferredoxin oxidoreductase